MEFQRLRKSPLPHYRKVKDFRNFPSSANYGTGGIRHKGEDRERAREDGKAAMSSSDQRVPRLPLVMLALLNAKHIPLG